MSAVVDAVDDLAELSSDDDVEDDGGKINKFSLAKACTNSSAPICDKRSSSMCVS